MCRQQLQKEPRALPGMQDDDDEMLEEPSPLATRRHVSMVEAARGKTVAEVHYLPPLAGDELIDPKDVVRISLTELPALFMPLKGTYVCCIVGESVCSEPA